MLSLVCGPKRWRKSLKSKQDVIAYAAKKEALQTLELLESQGYVDLFYGDESGFTLTPVTAYAWQYKGEQIKILPQKSKRLNVFGVMSAGKRLTSFLKEGSIKASFVVNCIEEWMKTLHKPTVLVLDNAPVHRAQLQAKIKEWQERDLFIFFCLLIALTLIRLNSCGVRLNMSGSSQKPTAVWLY